MKRIAAPLASFTFLILAALPLQAAEMKDTPGIKTGANKAAAEQTHKGSGTVKGVDAKAGKISLAHGPVSSLSWPAMTMDFEVRDKPVHHYSHRARRQEIVAVTRLKENPVNNGVEI